MSVKKRLIVRVLILLPLGALIAFSVLQYLDRDGEAVIPPGLPVIVEEADRRTMERILSFTGNLEPTSTVYVIPQVPGRVVEILVGEGDLVQEGQLLVRMDDEVVAYQRDQARASLKAAEAQLEQATSGLRDEEIAKVRALLDAAEKDVQLASENLDRAKRLYTSGTISKAKYDETESQVRAAETEVENAKRDLRMMEQGARQEELDMAQAQVDGAQAQYNLADWQVTKALITSPVTGIVAKVLVDENNLVGQRDAVLVIVQDDPISASVPVPERYFGEFLEREANADSRPITARVSPHAYQDGRVFAGTVTATDTVVDAVSRTFALTVEIANPRRLLRPGMYVGIELVVDVYDAVIVVASSAVSTRDGETGVFVVDYHDQPMARFTPVRPGISSHGLTAIMEGLSGGEDVIVDGNAFLEDGQFVRVVRD